MANTSSTYGLRAVRKIDGSPFINAQNRYRIAASEGTAIFQGDAVQAAATGTIVRHTAANGEKICGVFNGCFYTDPTTSKPTWSNYYPGSIAASDIMAFVVDDPSVVYKIDVNDDLNTTFIFQNFDVVKLTLTDLMNLFMKHHKNIDESFKTFGAVTHKNFLESAFHEIFYYDAFKTG